MYTIFESEDLNLFQNIYITGKQWYCSNSRLTTLKTKQGPIQFHQHVRQTFDQIRAMDKD